MSATALVLRVLSIFERLAIPYMLVGSYSSKLSDLFEGLYANVEACQ